MTFNKKWFIDQLKRNDLSMRTLAKRIGLDVAAISRTFDGKRKLQLVDAESIAKEFSVPVIEVIQAAGIQAITSNMNNGIQDLIIRLMKHSADLAHECLLKGNNDRAALVMDDVNEAMTVLKSLSRD
jgi:transcriptional regulator with XRE-family HTH domain